MAKLLMATLVIAVGSLFFSVQADNGPKENQAPVAAFPPPGTIVEARSRARLLHETIHGALQVMHRDHFEEERSRSIPSASLEDVFSELSKSYDVELKWLVVHTDVVNVDHQPKDEFEKEAVKHLAKGEPLFEAVEGGRYRFAGPIRLASQCLRCHVKGRSSTEDRTAGLLLSMPLGPKTASSAEPAPKAD